MKRLCFLAAIVFAVSAAQAALITTLENADFDDGPVTTPGPFTGFDTPVDIPGWTDINGPLADAGVEGPGAWWNPYDFNAAFIISGAAAYTMSDYTIQAGDVYTIAYYAQCWEWGGVGEWTATLFYDDPANVIGSFVSPGLAANGNWTAYSNDTPIPATVASEGGKLGIIFASTGQSIAQVDEITIDVVPEPTTFGLIALAGLGMLLRRRR